MNVVHFSHLCNIAEVIGEKLEACNLCNINNVEIRSDIVQTITFHYDKIGSSSLNKTLKEYFDTFICKDVYYSCFNTDICSIKNGCLNDDEINYDVISNGYVEDSITIEVQEHKLIIYFSEKILDHFVDC